jgi:Dolichyl-phosphate-mannose-protein mannosyltransferase
MTTSIIDEKQPRPLNLSAWIPELDGTRGMAVVLALAAYGLVRSVFTAASTPFWYDEICTWIVVRQPTVSGMYDALRHAADSNPPVFYLIERFAAALVKNEHIGLRIPSLIGFPIVLVCVFLFVKARSNSTVALVCTAAAFMTTLFEPYATEARPYSLVAACISFGLVCYQRAPATRWMCLLGISLVLAEALHYFAIFSVVPFCAAEGFFLLRVRQFRWKVWLALLCGFLPLAVFWPLLVQLKSYYGAHPWALPVIANVTPIYGWFFHTATPIGIGIAAALSVFIFIALTSPRMLSNQGADAPSHQLVLVLAFLALPIIAFVATKITHGMMVNRYVLPSVFGILMACGYLLQWLGRKSVAVFAVFVLFVLAFQERSFWVVHRGHLMAVHSPVEDVEGTLGALNRHRDLPVVVSDGLDYLPMAYYASPEQARRFVSLVDPPASVTYQGSDSVDKDLVVLRSYAPLQVRDFSAFVSEHREFLLYSRGGLFDWWPARLVREGYSLRALVAEKNVRVYLVDGETTLVRSDKEE